MSTYYTCDIYLDIGFSEQILKKLLEKGADLGFKYLEQESYSQVLDRSKLLNDRKVLERIMLGRGSESENFDFPKGVAVSLDDLLFSIDFYEIDYNLNLHLLSLSTDGKKLFQGKEYFDFGRHVELLIKLCEDYPISKIETCAD